MSRNPSSSCITLAETNWEGRGRALLRASMKSAPILSSSIFLFSFTSLLSLSSTSYLPCGFAVSPCCMWEFPFLAKWMQGSLSERCRLVQSGHFMSLLPHELDGDTSKVSKGTFCRKDYVTPWKNKRMLESFLSLNQCTSIFIPHRLQGDERCDWSAFPAGNERASLRGLFKQQAIWLQSCSRTALHVTGRPASLTRPLWVIVPNQAPISEVFLTYEHVHVQRNISMVGVCLPACMRPKKSCNLNLQDFFHLKLCAALTQLLVLVRKK